LNSPQNINSHARAGKLLYEVENSTKKNPNGIWFSANEVQFVSGFEAKQLTK